TAEQAAAVLKAAEGSRLGAYVVLCLMTGIRTEEARALRWDHVNLDTANIAVWRAGRLGGGNHNLQVPADPTAAPGGRCAASGARGKRGLAEAAVAALQEHRVRQDEEKLAAGELWRDHNLVFTTTVGTELDAANVRRSFRTICRAAGVGDDWAPRELRTS